MQHCEAEVSSRKPPSKGVAKYISYETWDEVWTGDCAIGETKALELLNAQIKTNAMNETRGALTKGPSKSLLRSEAFNEIMQEVAAGSHTEVIGNKPALDALLQKRMDEIEARMREAAGAGAGASAIEVEDDEDDEAEAA